METLNKEKLLSEMNNIVNGYIGDAKDANYTDATHILDKLSGAIMYFSRISNDYKEADRLYKKLMTARIDATRRKLQCD